MTWRDPLTVLALGLAGVAIWHLGNRAGAAEALAEARRDSIEVAFSRSDSLINELLLERDRAQAVSVQRDSAYAAIRTRWRTVYDTLTIHDTVEVRAALEFCDSALTACDSVVSAQRVELGIQDTIIRSLRPALVEARELWREAEDRARDRPWGLGVTCGLIAGQPGVGLGCAGGITYRWRVPWP